MKLLLAMPGGTEWIIIFIAFSFIIPFIFYLLTLQSTLQSIALQNRKMPAGNVWLLLIPLFSNIWHFIVINKMADSINAEATEKGISLSEQKPAYNIGLAMCILNCLFFVPALKTVASIAWLVCWIIYWGKKLIIIKIY